MTLNQRWSMKKLSNERGIMLVTALLLTLLTLAIVLLALYFIGQQTAVSSASKRYRSALEASHGGAEVFTKEIIPMLFNGYSSSTLIQKFSSTNSKLGLTFTTSNACLNDKLNKGTSKWTNCANDPDPFNPKSLYEAKFHLSGLPMQPGYNVYAKIVDTQAGNSDTSGMDLLDNGSGVAGIGSTVTPKHIPAIYRVEIQGEKETPGAQENAKLTVLYSY
jgi:hypothetical protein